MIRSTGRFGVPKALGQVLWLLRYDLLAVLIVAAAMAALSDRVTFQGAAAIVPFSKICPSKVFM